MHYLNIHNKIVVALISTALLFAINAKSIMAQNDVLMHYDSLYRNAKQDSTKVLHMSMYAYEYRNTNIDSALNIAERGIKLSREIEFKKGEGTCLLAQGLIYWKQGNYSVALNSLLEALRIMEMINNKQGMLNCYNNIGGLYTEQKEFEKAAEYYNKGLIIAKELNNKLQLTRIYNNFGEIERIREDYNMSLIYYKKSLKIAHEINRIDIIANLEMNMGLVYQKLKRTDLAIQNFNNSLTKAKKSSDIELISLNMSGLAECYLSKNDYNKSIEFGKQALILAKQNNSLEATGTAASILYLAYKKTNNCRSALAVYEISIAVKDSMYNFQTKKKLYGLQSKYEMEGKQKEIALLKKKEENQKLYLALFGLGSGLLLIITIIILRSFRIEHNAKMKLAKQKEEIESKNQELSELNATKDKFFSIIAHDLRNPFNSLLGFTNLLLKNIGKFSLPEIEQIIGLIRKSSLQASDLLDNLLIWSRSQTGKITFNPEVVDLHIQVNKTISFVEAQALRKEITITTNECENCVIMGDLNMIQTVLRNLTTNALKYTNIGGKITINIVDKDDAFEIAIIDNGIGIAPEDVEKLFKIDSQLIMPGTSDEKGTGLGLILCRDFIERHNGKIHVESELGKGSSFIFTLPKENISIVS